MDSRVFAGTGVALVTPFLANGEVDFNGLTQVVNYTLDNNVDFLVVMGTTGESVVLNKDERNEVVQHIININSGKKPLVLGIGGNNTQQVLDTMTSQDISGVDGILSVAPYYNKPTQKGLFRHFALIAEKSQLPVIIYNVPGRTGSNIGPETTLELAYKVPNIVATKEASGSMAQIMSILRDRPDDFLVLSGDDALTLPMISLGADGVISVIANALPGQMATMVRLARKGDFIEARKTHYQLLETIHLLFQEGNPAGIKAALEALHLCEKHVRLPLIEASSDLSEKIAKAIQKFSEH